ncbi:MAG TPA: hypothetical protein VFA03_08080 [Acetobacteraceae bacterium]|nr:hypothetical protein [Acetobacteraceae bacterium]
MNPATLTALAALGGSAIGALASFATTWLTTHHQDQLQRRAEEMARREKLFGEFIVQASKLSAGALVRNCFAPAPLVPLYAVKAQLELFASKRTIDCANQVLETSIDTYFLPNEDFHDRSHLEPRRFDVLRPFTEACRAELGG